MSVTLLNGYLDDFWAAYDAHDTRSAITAQDALFRGIIDWNLEPDWGRDRQDDEDGFRLFLAALAVLSTRAGAEYSRWDVGDRFYQGPVPGAVWAALMHLAELYDRDAL